MTTNQKLRLGDVCSKIGSGATPRGGKEAYHGGDTALIRSKNIYNDGFHREGLVYIDDNQSAELRNVEVKPNDVLLNITGDSVARCCQVPEDVLPARVNQHVAIIRPNSKILDAKFLRYVLTSKDYQSRLLGLSSAGATRPALTKAMIEDFEVLTPDIAEQHAIAHVLGSLDDKIELNRQMNETLEEMARTLFRSWFVDFDPVHAKAEDRQPEGMDAETAALFPSEFVESELGMIPKGWKPGTVSDFAGLYRETINPLRHPEEKFHHFSLPAFDDGQMPILELGEAIKSNKGIVPLQAVLVSKLNPHIPRVWLPSVEDNYRRVASTEFLVLEANQGISREFLYILFSSAGFMERFVGLVTGTSNSHQRVKPDDVLALYVVVPDLPAIQAFTKIVQPVLEKVQTNRDESRQLAESRNELLPKLISGEVRLPEDMIAEFAQGAERA